MQLLRLRNFYMKTARKSKLRVTLFSDFQCIVIRLAVSIVEA